MSETIHQTDSENTEITSKPRENGQGKREGGRSLRDIRISNLPDRKGELSPEVSTDEMIAALETYTGGVHFAARSLGCSAQAIYQRSWTDPRLKEVLMSYRGMLVDHAEKGLRNAVEREDAWAIQFTLKTLGKKRGYVERVETRNKTQLKGAMVTFLAPQQLTGLLGAEPTESLPDTPALPEHDPTAQTRS